MLFTMLIKSVDSDVAKIIFGDVDFKGFEIYTKTKMETNEDGEEVEVQVPTLYNTSSEMELSEDDYTLISEYLQTMFNIFPKVEKAKGKSTKEAIIEEDRIAFSLWYLPVSITQVLSINFRSCVMLESASLWIPYKDFRYMSLRQH